MGVSHPELWSLAAERPPAPGHDLVSDLVPCPRRRVEHVHVPPAIARIETPQAFPSHRVPAVGAQDVKHVVWILYMGAHPARECLVVGKQSGIVATLSEPRGLRFGADVEKTDGDRVELVGGGCGDHLAGSDRISGEQKVPTDSLKVQRPLHGSLGSLLPPRNRGYGQVAGDVT